jgi:hypothetical protein
MQIKRREARENVTTKIRSPVASLGPTKEVSRYAGAYTCSGRGAIGRCDHLRRLELGLDRGQDPERPQARRRVGGGWTPEIFRRALRGPGRGRC